MLTSKSALDHLRYWKGSRRWPGPGGFVYVLSAGAATGPIKIGKARDVTKRIAELQTGNPFELELRGVLVGYSDLERELHEMLRSCHSRGEWFDGDEVPAFLDFVMDLSTRMIHACESNGKIPNHLEFSPWREREEDRGERRPSRITDEQLNRVGRLSAARHHPYPGKQDDPQKRAFDHAQSQPIFTPHKAA